jgi:hypothetical protein
MLRHAALAVLLAGAVEESPPGARAPGALPQGKPEPVPFDERGRLVCLLEEMKDAHKLEINPIHAHLVGFRVEAKDPPGGVRYYTVLRTKLAEAFFVDRRYQGRELRVRGKVFPSTALLEVTKFQWYRDGTLTDVYYWCEICAIKSFDPEICACCQAKVEFRESPAEDRR